MFKYLASISLPPKRLKVEKTPTRFIFTLLSEFPMCLLVYQSHYKTLKSLQGKMSKYFQENQRAFIIRIIIQESNITKRQT